MNGNTEEDIEKTDDFNAFMIHKKIFLKDIMGQVSINPEVVYVGSGDVKIEYTLAMALADYKKYKGK